MARHKAEPTTEAQAANLQALVSAPIELPKGLTGRHTAKPSPEAVHAEVQAYYLTDLDWTL